MSDFYVVRDELYHHGILGQKHGDRNGPPYPLSAGAHSSSERKAGWRKSLNGPKHKSKKDRYVDVEYREVHSSSAGGKKRGAGDRVKGAAKKGWEKVKGAGKKVNDSGAFDQSIKTKNGKISPAEKMSKDATNAARNAGKLHGYLQEGKLAKQKAEVAKEASQLSDKELQQRINRLQLEQRYSQLSQPQVSAGSARVERALNIAVTSLEIGASAVAIAAGVQALRKPKGV